MPGTSNQKAVGEALVFVVREGGVELCEAALPFSILLPK